jgi:hypothetical protein
MNVVTTSIDPATGGVVISWTAPNNNSETIDAYNIEILDSTGTVWT